MAHDTAIMTICGAVNNAAWMPRLLRNLPFVIFAFGLFSFGRIPVIQFCRAALKQRKFKQLGLHILRVASLVVPFKFLAITVMMRVVGRGAVL